MHGVATSLLCWTEVWSSFLVRAVSGKLFSGILGEPWGPFDLMEAHRGFGGAAGRLGGMPSNAACFFCSTVVESPG